MNSVTPPAGMSFTTLPRRSGGPSPLANGMRMKSTFTPLASLSPLLRTLATTSFVCPTQGVFAHFPGSAFERSLRISMSGLFHSGGPFHGRMPGSALPPALYWIWTTALSAAFDLTVTTSFFWLPGSMSS